MMPLNAFLTRFKLFDWPNNNFVTPVVQQNSNKNIIT